MVFFFDDDDRIFDRYVRAQDFHSRMHLGNQLFRFVVTLDISLDPGLLTYDAISLRSNGS